MSAHTKGPWRADHFAIQVKKDTTKPWEPDGEDYENNTVLIAEVDWHKDMKPEAMANARLIAAAPELFSALELLISLSGPIDDEDDLVLKHHSAAMQKALSAIRKARGEK